MINPKRKKNLCYSENKKHLRFCNCTKRQHVQYKQPRVDILFKNTRSTVLINIIFCQTLENYHLEKWKYNMFHNSKMYHNSDIWNIWATLHFWNSLHIPAAISFVFRCRNYGKEIVLCVFQKVTTLCFSIRGLTFFNLIFGILWSVNIKNCSSLSFQYLLKASSVLGLQ